MDINKAFDDLQRAANADPDQVSEARARRDLFKKAFEPQDDVVEVIPSGSLARSTQREPINDVDVIIVFKRDAHPDWATDGDSAADALDYTRQRVNELLGATNGTIEKAVRLARPNNHAVKCFLDDPEDPNAFTVDAMPALRQDDGTLLVPEKLSQRWINTNPEHLIEKVRKRQEQWDQFRPLVRILKLWKDAQDTGLKSLTVEVLALNHLPEETSRAKALQRFFHAAEIAIDSPIEDPAGLCGEIQPKLDRAKAKEAIKAAASSAWHAINAQEAGDSDRAGCLWREVFGDDFPEPSCGCATGNGGSGLGEGISIGITGVGVTLPRPVTDAPQG
jgi:hypothetical protein